MLSRSGLDTGDRYRLSLAVGGLVVVVCGEKIIRRIVFTPRPRV